MISEKAISDLLQQAKNSERKRAHLLLHENHEALLHRLVIGLTKGTYVKPHNHAQSGKEEVLFVLSGEVCVVYFDQSGEVIEKQFQKAGEINAYSEHTANTWHTLFPVTDSAVIIEIKRGPFVPTSPEEFASWAPNEGEGKAAELLEWLAQCNIGDNYCGLADS